MSLAGWTGGKIVISIDNSNIDSDLSNFPINILLSTSAGTNSKDLTEIFTEIGSDANRKKIAVASHDDTNECYVEIEDWNNVSKTASLWVKVPTVFSGDTTNLFLYFDSAHIDNVNHVVDTGDTPAELVWDNNYKAVYHFAQDPSGGAPQLIDSTSNGNDLTAQNMEGGDLVYVGARKAWDMDGANEYASGGIPFLIAEDQDFTVDAICSIDDFTSVHTWSLDQGPDPYLLGSIGSAGQASMNWKNVDETSSVVGTAATASTQTLITHKRDGATAEVSLYDDTYPDGSTVTNSISTKSIGGSALWIGNYTAPFDGRYIEFRVSDIARSTAWDKATSYATTDNILKYGNFGDASLTLPSFTVSATTPAGDADDLVLPLLSIYGQEYVHGNADLFIPLLETDAISGATSDESIALLGLYAAGYSTEIYIADLSIPSLGIEINTGFSADIEYQPLELTSTGIHTYPFIGDSILPFLSMSATPGMLGSVDFENIIFSGSGIQGIVGGINRFLPRLISDAYLNVIQNGTVDVRIKRLLIESAAKVGGAHSLSLVYPSLALEIEAVFGVIGSANIGLPAVEEVEFNSYNNIVGNMTGELNI